MILSDLLWFRTVSGGGAGTIPKVRLFDSSGVQVFPDAGSTKDLTISETWQNLRTLWPEACLDTLKTPHGFLCDEVSEDIDVAISPISPGAAGQRSFQLVSGQGMAYGTAPLGPGGDMTTVSVTGEVLTSTYSRTMRGTGSIAAVNGFSDPISCAGMNSIALLKTSSNSMTPTVVPQVSYDNGVTWSSARAYTVAANDTRALPTPLAGVSWGTPANGIRIYADTFGATHFRLQWSAGAPAVPPEAVTFQYGASSDPFIPPIGSVDSSGRLNVTVGSITPPHTHGSAVTTTAFMQMGEARISSDGTPVSQGQNVRAVYTGNGAALVRNDALLSQKWTYSTPSGGITTATKTTLKPLESLTVQCLKDLSVKNHSNTAVWVTIYSASSNTGDLAGESDVLWRGKVDGDGPIPGSVENFTIERKTSSGHAIVIHTDAAGEIEVNAGGYKVAG